MGGDYCNVCKPINYSVPKWPGWRRLWQGAPAIFFHVVRWLTVPPATTGTRNLVHQLENVLPDEKPGPWWYMMIMTPDVSIHHRLSGFQMCATPKRRFRSPTLCIGLDAFIQNQVREWEVAISLPCWCCSGRSVIRNKLYTSAITPSQPLAAHLFLKPVIAPITKQDAIITSAHFKNYHPWG